MIHIYQVKGKIRTPEYTHLVMIDMTADQIFEPKDSYSYDEIIACAGGQLFGSGNAQLPKPPMLMFDRITSISEKGGSYNKGQVLAEFDIKPE